MIDKEVTVIGAGLAGAEAAWQIANSDVPVKLVEMRPYKSILQIRPYDELELI